jgi:hypothetical protein
MNLDEFIISMFVTIDDELKIVRQRLYVSRLRQRGPAPKLSDAEVLTLECVGEVLDFDCDKHLFAYFARHFRHFFPALAQTHRTTFVRQAANLWHTKELLWRRLVRDVAPADDRLHIVDNMPIPVCRFARAPFCRSFRGAARYGKDHADRQTFYGFRLHARLTWPGLLSEVVLAPANQSEQSVLPHLASTAPAGCAILGDRNYCVPWLKECLRADEQRLLTPPARQAKHDPEAAQGHAWSLSNLRYRIDTVFGQLTDRFHIKRVWARDLWHLTGRIYRKVLAHTLVLILNMEQGNTPLQFDRLLST